MTLHETAGTELVPAKPRNLPLRILRALDNAMHLSGLKRNVRDTLAEICRFVSQSRPFETIFAHKSTIAARSGASERTIYRHLAVLQQHGLLEVLEQDRKSRNGRFAVARIRITPLAASLLGFVDQSDQAFLTPSDTRIQATSAERLTLPKDSSEASKHSAPTDCEKHPCHATNDTAYEEVIPSSPSDKMACGHTLSVPTYSKNHPRQRTENGLPIDLTWMTANGLSRAGIFKLMGIAKNHGKRLSDIVTVVHQYICELKGGKLYAYLAKLAAGPTDFSVAAATERHRQVSIGKARIQARKEEVFRVRFSGTSLTNQSQTRLYVIDGNARFAQIYGAGYPITVPLTDLTEWIERIESGRLVLATLNTERSFLA